MLEKNFYRRVNNNLYKKYIFLHMIYLKILNVRVLQGFRILNKKKERIMYNAHIIMHWFEIRNLFHL